MNNEIIITKKMADIIVQICADVVEFSKLYEQNHPKSAKNLFQRNEDVKKGSNCFINSSSQSEIEKNLNDYINSISIVLQMHNDLSFPYKIKVT